MESLGDVVQEIQRGEGVGLVTEQAQKAGGGQGGARLVAEMPEVLHGEEVGGVFVREPEGVAPPGPAPRKRACLSLQLGQPSGDDIVKPVEEHSAHGGIWVVSLRLIGGDS